MHVSENRKLDNNTEIDIWKEHKNVGLMGKSNLGKMNYFMF